MFVYFVPPASYPVQTGAAKAHFGEGAMVPYNAYMAIKNVDGAAVSTWVPSVNDFWPRTGESLATPFPNRAFRPTSSACWMRSANWTSACPSWTPSFWTTRCTANSPPASRTAWRASRRPWLPIPASWPSASRLSTRLRPRLHKQQPSRSPWWTLAPTPGARDSGQGQKCAARDAGGR